MPQQLSPIAMDWIINQLIIFASEAMLDPGWWFETGNPLIIN